MKKLCGFLVVLIVLLISGCNKEINQKNEAVTPPSFDSVILDVTFKSTEMSAKLTKHSPQKYELQMLSPEIMKPLNLIYENDICTVTYDGLTFETDMKRFPQSEFGGILISSLKDIDGGIISKTPADDGTIIYKGITDYGDFNLIYDKNTGLWKEFSVEGAELKIIFRDYTIKG